MSWSLGTGGNDRCCEVLTFSLCGGGGVPAHASPARMPPPTRAPNFHPSRSFFFPAPTHFPLKFHSQTGVPPTRKEIFKHSQDSTDWPSRGGRPNQLAAPSRAPSCPRSRSFTFLGLGVPRGFRPFTVSSNLSYLHAYQMDSICSAISTDIRVRTLRLTFAIAVWRPRLLPINSGPAIAGHRRVGTHQQTHIGSPLLCRRFGHCTAYSLPLIRPWGSSRNRRRLNRPV